MTELKKPEPTIVARVNAAAAKVSDVLMEARNAARDELLWLAAQYRELLAERDRLAAALEAAREDAERWRALREILVDCDEIHPEQADAAIDRARGRGNGHD